MSREYPANTVKNGQGPGDRTKSPQELKVVEMRNPKSAFANPGLPYTFSLFGGFGRVSITRLARKILPNLTTFSQEVGLGVIRPVEAAFNCLVLQA